MKVIRSWVARAARATALGFATVAIWACNNVGDCPAPAAITPGAACSGDLLQCPYSLESPSPACDGTSLDGGVATSCVCTSGSWVCPQSVTCPAAGDGGDDGGGDGSADDGGGDDAARDAAAE